VLADRISLSLAADALKLDSREAFLAEAGGGSAEDGGGASPAGLDPGSGAPAGLSDIATGPDARNRSSLVARRARRKWCPLLASESRMWRSCAPAVLSTMGL
jgi:hypothetical protein